MTERIDEALRIINFEVASLKAAHRSELERRLVPTPAAIDAALDGFWTGVDWRTMDPPFLERCRSDMRDALVMGWSVMQRGRE